MSTGAQTCDVVLPGYTLADRIGSGGYAEVWRAEAPGGIQKAVKIVYGYYDDEFACQELKALERIKTVRHPFLLSLERFEIINGRLAILTELADMSLDQRMRECRAEGLLGIPREELLQYMADAAEALDYLSQKHSLLHLDIKPENLLVLGDHIKVADFGLVKELASRTQNSLVSGMTPTYASPEMFDDDPSARSDQYSLAIVYQEMLVGTLPFPGRTAAQLAKQHTQAEPQLKSLPPQDRPVIARALAKRPEDRFPSCREFVETLMGRAPRSAGPSPPDAPRAAPVSPTPSSESDTKSPLSVATLRRIPGQPLSGSGPTITQPIDRSGPASDAPPPPVVREPFVPEESTDVPVPVATEAVRTRQPTLFIGVGGIGAQVLCQLRELAAARGPSADQREAVEAIALDTNRDELREAASRKWKAPLAADDILHMPLRLPKSYDNSREILGWVSRRWLYNIPRSLETRGFRPLGRVALVDHARRILALLNQKLQQLTEKAAAAADAELGPLRVVLLAGSGGGTGSGMAIDVANAVRSLAAAQGINLEVQAFFICTCLSGNNSTPLVAANTYSLLAELSHATAAGNRSAKSKAAQATPFESPEAPFDCVYCVPTRARTARPLGDDALESLATYLALESLPEVQAALRACRTTATPREQQPTRPLVLRKLGVASLAEQKRELIRGLAVDLARAVKQRWLTLDESADWPRLVRAEEKAASEAKLVPAGNGDATAPPEVAPVDEASPLALRGRFQGEMSLQFASDALSQVARQLAARDERGRPLLLPREAKLVADAARDAIFRLASRLSNQPEANAQAAASPALQPIVVAASESFLGRAVAGFDPKQPERFLDIDAVDELLHAECLAQLEARLADAELAASLAGSINLNEAVARTVEHAERDLLQCGSDRRTLVVIPRDQEQGDVAEKVRALRPLAAVVPADVDDVLVISEESGLSPHSLGLALNHVYPGIADAAHRLHTRIDVEWQSLV